MFCHNPCMFSRHLGTLGNCFCNSLLCRGPLREKEGFSPFPLTPSRFIIIPSPQSSSNIKEASAEERVSATCLTTFKSVALQLHELCCAMGLPATHKIANKEDRGEDNEDPDWLIKQSNVGQVAGGVHCTTQKKPIQSLQQLLGKVKSGSTFCNACGNNKIVRQFA